MKFAHILTCFAIALGLCDTASAQTARVPVVAAENFYGDVIWQPSITACRWRASMR